MSRNDIKAPDWWCGKGSQVKRIEESHGRSLIVKTKVGTISIHRIVATPPKGDWRVIFEKGGPNVNSVRCELYFTTGQLQDAFDLENIFSEKTLNRKIVAFLLKHKVGYGESGLYIRHSNYLNLPGPGTGLPGDANCSLFLDSEVKEAVQALIDFFTSDDVHNFSVL